MARRSVGRLGVLVGVGALVASTSLIWVALKSDPGKNAANEGPVATATEQAPAGPDLSGPRAPGCRFSPGQRLAYTLDVSTQVQVDPSRLNLPAGAQLGGVSPSRTTKAHLDLKVLTAEASGAAVLLARYGYVDPQTVAEAGALDGPFLLKVNERCKIAGYARLDSTGTSSARVQQALAHELQWFWPAGDKGTDEGETAFGRYQAAYVADGSTVDRTIETYTKVWASRGTLGTGKQRTGKPAISTMKVAVGTGPWFASLTSREKLVGLGLVDTDTTTKVAGRDPTTGVLDEAPTDESRYIWENMFTRPVARVARPVQRSREHMATVEKMKEVKLPAALDMMYDAINKDQNIAHVWPVMVAYLEAHPDDAQDVVDKLKAGEIADGAVAATFIALGQTPTPQARDALWGLKDDTKAAAILRSQSAFALVDRADVGVTLARSLVQDSQNLSKGATRSERLFSREAVLALGMMAGLKADDTEIKEVAAEGALNLMKAGHNATAIRPAISALANIGDASLLPHVMPHTRSADPKIREAATGIFRRMPPAETAALTVEWLARENDPFVKRRLYKTLNDQLFDAREAPHDRIVDQAIVDLARSTSVITRQSIIHILGPIAPQNPRAREALVRQVKRESDENTGLLKMLGQYLAAPDIARGMEMP